MGHLLENSPRAIEKRLRERPAFPLPLWEVASADLPPAANHMGCLVSCPDIAGPVYSDGAHWYPLNLGAAL